VTDFIANDPYMGYRAPDDWMELVLWITYLSTIMLGLGYFIYVPLGFFAVVIWMQIWDWVGFFQLLGGYDLMAYVTYPMRRFQVGFVIYTLGFLLLWIPGLNLVLAPLLGYWAIQDYYDYDYEVFLFDEEGDE
jgi:hypothetical protein